MNIGEAIRELEVEPLQWPQSPQAPANIPVEEPVHVETV